MAEKGKVPDEFSFVEDWFTPRELNKRFNFTDDGDGLDRFWDWITGGANCQVPGPSELVNVQKYYRGQTRSWHGFTSSLYRVCKDAVYPKQNSLADVQVTEAHLAAAEQAVIAALRQEGMGRRMTDGELLMICQHHAVPTRLIDVSTQPLEALFFAAEKEDGTDGRLFVVAPHQEGSSLPHSRLPMKLSKSATQQDGPGASELPWADTVRGEKQSNNKWSIEVRLVDENPLDPRMRAQAGKFLVGGVHRAYSGLNMPGISNFQRPDISSLAINFTPSTGSTKVSQAWRASGWSVRIHASWKEEIRRRLANLKEPHGIENIVFDSMYPPISQIERLGKHVAKQGVASVIQQDD